VAAACSAWGRRGREVRVSSGDPKVTSDYTNLKHWKLVGKKLLEVI
jgi:hypothetical protein